MIGVTECDDIDFGDADADDDDASYDYDDDDDAAVPHPDDATVADAAHVYDVYAAADDAAALDGPPASQHH